MLRKLVRMKLFTHLLSQFAKAIVALAPQLDGVRERVELGVARTKLSTVYNLFGIGKSRKASLPPPPLAIVASTTTMTTTMTAAENATSLTDEHTVVEVVNHFSYYCYFFTVFFLLLFWLFAVFVMYLSFMFAAHGATVAEASVHRCIARKSKQRHAHQ